MPKFITPYTNLRIVIEPDDIAEVKGRFRRVPGKHIVFDRGEYITEDPKEIKFLREYASNPGNKVFEEKAIKPKVIVKEKVVEKYLCAVCGKTFEKKIALIGHLRGECGKKIIK